MTALPTDSAVTFPFSTLATLKSDEDQIIVLSVVFSGNTVAVRVKVSPIVSVAEVRSSVTDDASTGLTVTKHSALTEPH